jgi:heat shock protein HslJ
MIPRTALALLTLSALALAACGSDDDSPAATDSLPGVGAAPAAADLEGRAFEATSVTGHELVADSTIELFFDADRVSARAGCNSMNGGYTISDGTLEVAAMASTMMACSDELMAQDTWLNEFLSSGPAIALDGATLTLTGDDAAITLAEIEGAPLVGTTWNVTGTVANEAVSSVPGEAVASITIADDGTVAVETGCNSGSGPVEVADTTLTFGAIAVTMRACTDEAVNELEASVLTALQGEVTYEINGDSLSIRSGEGADAVGLEFTAAG